MLLNMKTILVGIALLAVLGVAAEAASRDELWRKVDEAVSQGLPRTAITNLNLIIPAAVADQAWGEAAKAIGRKIVMEANIEGNKAEEKITRMQAEIAKAPPQIVPLLCVMEANWWWQYFQNNRWRFLRRTATAQTPGADFTTWDLPRLFAEIDKVYGEALSAADTLKKIPVSQFDDLLVKGTLPDSYRPTLYDFVANQALKFYTSGEQAGAKPEDAFEIAATSPILGSVAEFIAWNPQTAETNAPAYKAIRLYQDLLRFHEKNVDLGALLDADLARLAWAYNVAFGEDKAARYKTALKAFVDKWADHELTALALHQWATVLQSEGDLVEARRLALRGEGAHPNSPGGLMCHNLAKSIEAKSTSVTTERVWNQPWPKIAVRYRNVTNIYFRAVVWDWNEFLEKRHARPEYLNQADRDSLLARKPVLEWSAALPATPDFKERTVELPAPATLKPGFYFIIASHDPKFGDADNQITFSDVWVSDLALVVVTRDGDVGGFVLNANSGEPIAGAEVVAWYLDNNGNRRTNGSPQRTDANGRFNFTPTQNRPLLLRAGANGQELGTMQEYGSWKPGRPQPNDQVVFFTDRALYRPGQTISYKGIAVHVDQERNNYEVLKGREIEVVFFDPNGKEVDKLTQRANDFGSIHGSFTAPRDRVMGQYQISARSGANGATWFNVEEYKRPKFQVTLDAPKTAPKLNDSVTLSGKAEAYTGAAIDGAQVKWRVVREVRWPDWWGWWGWGWRGGISRGNASQEIAHGTGRTDANGAFQVQFNAKPDPAVDEKSEASFNFHIYADVTDTAGETRSADRGVNVGFVALRANISADDWQTATNAVALNLLTTTLDGEPQKAEGALKIVRLKDPAQVQRARLPGMPWPARSDAEEGMDLRDMANPNNWPEGEVVFEKGWTTDAEGKAAFSANLGVGVYRALVETQDRFGKKVTARTQLTVLDPGADKLAIKIPNLVKAPQWKAEAGTDFMALWGTGYETGRAFVEVEHRGKFLQSYWTKAGATQVQIRQAVSEAMRGGFTVHVTQVRENRAYLQSQRVDVPWSNKELELTWEHFVSKLQPGQQETWSLVVKDSKGKAQSGKIERLAAEMVATLYDESLDQYRRLDWLRRFGFFYHDYSQRGTDFANLARQFNHLRGGWSTDYRSVDRRYREFPSDLVANFWGFMWAGRGNRMFGMRARGGGMGGEMMEMANMPAPAAAPMAADALGMEGAMAKSAEARMDKDVSERADARKTPARLTAIPGQVGAKEGGDQSPVLSQVTARKNLNETAFFFPQLTTYTNGVVRITFTMPEALTQWHFLGFAYDTKLRSGALDDHAVTAKDIMVQPNPPRFLREGDVLEFTVKVSNQSAARQTGKVQLTFRNAATEESADALLGNKSLAQNFDIPAKESRSFAWRIKVPDGAPFLAYKAVASTGRLSDGEEGYLPVLSRRIFVTESLPLPVRVKSGQGAVTKKFEFTKLLQSGKSDTLVSENLVVQMVSNPSWYAVLALPYLMEYPYECNEQTFNRLYANALARHIANSDPKIRRIFDLWKNTPALDSPLEKNQDLKSVMLEETPWVRQAQNESQARKNVGILFDDNRLNIELASALNKLREGQLSDGSWPWFPGGRGDDYITLYITAGFGRLRQLGVEQVDVAPAIRALARLDNWMHEHYLRIQQLPHPEEYVLSPTDALFLYARSFFLKDRAVAKNHEEAIQFFLKQGRALWLKTANRQSQGQLAIAVKRFNAVPAFSVANDPTPMAIMRSLKERSVTSEELGMFWRDLELSWWWYRAPIETQALMIEAFDEVAGDRDAVEECRVWLLKQKQTQDWKTTKATADAVYALLLRGKDILASDKLVEVMIGGVNITPKVAGTGPQLETQNSKLKTEVEPGTGFYEVRFTGKDIKPKMGEITVKKSDEGVAWGSVHWQYLEDMTKVTPYEGTPLKLKKALFTKVNTARGPELQPVKSAVAVGDELVVRIELRVDRDMEYIHLKDQRGSGTEPVNVLSRYKYQDGLGYYETTRDTASHFFIAYLPKGTYVFEYSTRVQHRGEYQTGMASIQCMYAPEFNSHSESFQLTVR